MRSGGAPCAATSATAAVRDVVHSVPSTLYMFGHSVPVHVGLPLPGGCQTFVSRGPNGGHMDHNGCHQPVFPVIDVKMVAANRTLCGGANCLRSKRNLFPTQQLTSEAHSFGWQSVAHYLITTRWVFTSQI